jgi:DNA-binding response OmpR family regulator
VLDGLRISRPAAAAVLVIAEDRGLLDSFTCALEAHGISVATARCAYEGLTAFRWNLPAVVLTDILMPEQHQMVMAMRHALPAVKIIAMSSGRASRSDFLTIAKRFGADAIVQKPFEVDELVKLLRTLLRAASSQAA